MIVIFLSAGYGSRLLPLTSKMHKSFIKFKGERIIDRQLKLFKKIKKIFIVGYKSNQFQKYLKNKKGVSLLYNPFFSIGDNLISTWCAKEYLFKDDFILINGDNIIGKEIEKKILNIKKNGIFLFCRKKDNLLLDDMKVTTNHDGTLKFISKELRTSVSNFESLGIILVKGKNNRISFMKSINLLEKSNLFFKSHWTEILNNIVEKKYVSVETIEIPKEYFFVEYDDHSDIVND